MVPSADDVVKKGLTAQRESKYVEFKRDFNPDSKEDWCSLIKEIVALANTGGGVVVVGLDNKGSPTGIDVSDVRSVDPAVFTDKVGSYTGYQFTEFETRDCEKDGHPLFAIVIAPQSIPLVFEKPGTYPVNDHQRTAFSRGTVYFRHGAKSEPAEMDDLRSAIERRLDEIRDKWLSDIRKVVYAEPGSEVVTVPSELIQSDDPSATPIKISDDPDAPILRLESPDDSYPYRQTEVLEKVQERLPDEVEINRYDIESVRYTRDVNEDPRFTYEPKFGSRQYSGFLVDWIVKQYEADPQFFEKARDDYYEMRYD